MAPVLGQSPQIDPGFCNWQDAADLISANRMSLTQKQPLKSSCNVSFFRLKQSLNDLL